MLVGNSNIFTQDFSFVKLPIQSMMYPGSQSGWTIPSHLHSKILRPRYISKIAISPAVLCAYDMVSAWGKHKQVCFENKVLMKIFGHNVHEVSMKLRILHRGDFGIYTHHHVLLE
jgi:hypothetical protein